MQVLGIHGFRFPLLLTSCHMGFSFTVLLPFMLREPFLSRHRATLTKQWRGLVAIGKTPAHVSERARLALLGSIASRPVGA